MSRLVADTSGLVSLAVEADGDPDVLAICLDTYDARIPETVVEALREIASYDDRHGAAASEILGRIDRVAVESVALDAEFPLDDGENAAVTLANESDAAVLLCDEFNRVGLVHASLASARLVTTPTLLAALVRRDRLGTEEAVTLLDGIAEARSWEANSYVERARSLLERS